MKQLLTAAIAAFVLALSVPAFADGKTSNPKPPEKPVTPVASAPVAPVAPAPENDDPPVLKPDNIRASATATANASVGPITINIGGKSASDCWGGEGDNAWCRRPLGNMNLTLNYTDNRRWLSNNVIFWDVFNNKSSSLTQICQTWTSNTTNNIDNRRWYDNRQVNIWQSQFCGSDQGNIKIRF